MEVTFAYCVCVADCLLPKVSLNSFCTRLPSSFYGPHQRQSHLLNSQSCHTVRPRQTRPVCMRLLCVLTAVVCLALPARLPPTCVTSCVDRFSFHVHIPCTAPHMPHTILSFSAPLSLSFVPSSFTSFHTNVAHLHPMGHWAPYQGGMADSFAVLGVPYLPPFPRTLPPRWNFVCCFTLLHPYLSLPSPDLDYLQALPQSKKSFY